VTNALMERTLDRASRSILSRNGKGTESERRAPCRKRAARRATLDTGKYRKKRGDKRGMEGWEKLMEMPTKLKGANRTCGEIP
jgi:hypothetical protein